MNIVSVKTFEEKEISASGIIDPREEFFQDHFPGFPVVPGVLILEIFRRTVQIGFGTSADGFLLKEIRSVRFSNYLRPGDEWEAHLERISLEGVISGWKGRLSSSGRPVCSAQFLIEKTEKGK